MKFSLIIDETKEEEITATVHSRSSLTEKIEILVMQHSGADRIPGSSGPYADERMTI